MKKSSQSNAAVTDQCLLFDFRHSPGHLPRVSGLSSESACARRVAIESSRLALERKVGGTRVMRIDQAETPEQIATIRCLFGEYAAWLGIDLSYQRFDEELAALPGDYAFPRGRLLLATDAGGPAGCVALRPLGDLVCEMKRLFVRPNHQGHGLGRALAERVIREARSIGYATMRLDTLPFMRSAIQLYTSLGFVRCCAYYDTPLPETVFLELTL